MNFRLATAIAFLGFNCLLQGAESFVPGVARAYLARVVPGAEIPRGMSLERGYAAQAQYVELLRAELGGPAGYKVGIVTKAGQDRLGLKHPLRGVLLEKMLLPDKSEVPIGYGIRPLLESDLVVTVKDEKINSANSLEEAVKGLDEIVAFIELADSTVSTNQAMDGPAVAAINVGARLGVLGERRKVNEIPNFIEACEKMRFVLKDGEGTELSNVEGTAANGNPLNALLWLIQDLRKSGDKLRTGDILSLGSPSPQVIPKAGQKFTLTYEKFPGKPLSATVFFKP